MSEKIEAVHHYKARDIALKVFSMEIAFEFLGPSLI